MKSKFPLTHVILYAKGWYLKTDNIWEDLIKILELDDYSPFTKRDVYGILVSVCERTEDFQFLSLRQVLQEIAFENCWKYGYYCKGHEWHSGTDKELEDYNMQTAFVYYILSCLRFLDDQQWTPKTPKYSKYPKNKHITVRSVYEHFVKKKS